MGKKEVNTRKLIDYLGDPNNEFLDRNKLAVTVLGYKNARSLYDKLSPAELDEIEHEAFEMRKARSVRERVTVYKALLKEAEDGNVPAIKEYLERMEGKVKERLKVEGDIGVTIRGILDKIDSEGRKEPNDV
jgi:hypothetical protein